MHEIWELFWEVAEEKWKHFFHHRMSKPWKENLFLIPIVIAIFVILIILVRIFIYPGKL